MSRSEDQGDASRRDQDPSSGSEQPAQQFISAPHPATWEPDELLRHCELRAQRRSGPGGQHRNKTSSGVFLTHPATGVVAGATERRSQADNRAVALTRLRFKLAVEVRTPSTVDDAAPTTESEYRARFCGSDLRLADRNPAKPAVLALILNDLHDNGGQPRLVADRWQTTTSAVVRLLRSHPPSLERVNLIRRHHRRGPLK